MPPGCGLDEQRLARSARSAADPLLQSEHRQLSTTSTACAEEPLESLGKPWRRND
jgi:hypothetical protein